MKIVKKKSTATTPGKKKSKLRHFVKFLPPFFGTMRNFPRLRIVLLFFFFLKNKKTGRANSASCFFSSRRKKNEKHF